VFDRRPVVDGDTFLLLKMLLPRQNECRVANRNVLCNITKNEFLKYEHLNENVHFTPFFLFPWLGGGGNIYFIGPGPTSSDSNEPLLTMSIC
jgi:hypothetical protein